MQTKQIKSCKVMGFEGENHTLALQIDGLDLARADNDLSAARAQSEDRRISNSRTPVYSLPNEILAIIFETACDLSHSSFEPFEVLISQVTERWRDVAINTPSLWTNIHIKAGNPSHITRATVYLLRSMVSPLEITLDCEMQPANPADILLVRETINPHADRWRELRIKCDRNERLFNCLKFLPNMVPLLQHIEVHVILDTNDSFDEDFDFGDEVPYKIFAAGAPSLKSIYLDGVSFRYFQPPLAAMKALHIEDPPFQAATTCKEFCSSLSPSLALTRLTISGDVFGTFWTPDGTLELPALRFLAIRPQGSFSIIPALLLAIYAPNLESMTLETLVYADLEPFLQTLDASASPKYPSLRSLTLSDGERNGFTRSAWRHLMHAFPTITHLTLSYRSLGEFLVSLQSRHSVPTLSAMITPWPNLHTLALNDNNFHLASDIGLYLLHQAVLARTVLGHPIRTLLLSEFIVDQLRREGDQLDHLYNCVAVEKHWDTGLESGLWFR